MQPTPNDNPSHARVTTMTYQRQRQHLAQLLYLSHGGGPLPLLGDASHQALVDFMVQLPSRLARPDALIVISAKNTCCRSMSVVVWPRARLS
jgi:aromatic ring-opening dioxygenase catalytic subunit (LigB family)